MCACHEGRLWARIDLLSFCSTSDLTEVVWSVAGAKGSQGLSVPASWLASQAAGGAGSVPHFADDMMDYPCHYRYSQRHSATDKTNALLHAGKAAIFLPGFSGPARAGVLPSRVGDITLGQTGPYFCGLGICHLSAPRENANISKKVAFE